MKAILHTLLGLTILSMVACTKTEVQNLQPQQEDLTRQHKADWQVVNTKPGRPLPDIIEAVRAYYNGAVYKLSLVKAIDEPGNGGNDISGIKRAPMELYVYENVSLQPVKDGLLPITSFVDAVGAPMFLREMKIHFNPGFAPRQFYSRDEIVNALSGIRPEISINPTGIAYRGNVAPNVTISIPKPEGQLAGSK